MGVGLKFNKVFSSNHYTSMVVSMLKGFETVSFMKRDLNRRSRSLDIIISDSYLYISNKWLKIEIINFYIPYNTSS